MRRIAELPASELDELLKGCVETPVEEFHVTETTEKDIDEKPNFDIWHDS